MFFQEFIRNSPRKFPQQFLTPGVPLEVLQESKVLIEIPSKEFLERSGLSSEIERETKIHVETFDLIGKMETGYAWIP